MADYFTEENDLTGQLKTKHMDAVAIAWDGSADLANRMLGENYGFDWKYVAGESGDIIWCGRVIKIGDAMPVIKKSVITELIEVIQKAIKIKYNDDFIIIDKEAWHKRQFEEVYIVLDNTIGTGNAALQFILNVAIRRLDDEQRTGLCIDLYERLNDEGKDAVKKYIAG